MENEFSMKSSSASSLLLLSACVVASVLTAGVLKGYFPGHFQKVVNHAVSIGVQEDVPASDSPANAQTVTLAGQPVASQAAQAHPSGTGKSLLHRGRGPEIANIGLTAMMQMYDQATLAPLFPGIAVWPQWIAALLVPAINEPVDEHGNRLLHIATRSGNQFAAWGLMNMGADPTILNRRNKTPLQTLRCRNRSVHAAIVACLQRRENSVAIILAAAEHVRSNEKSNPSVLTDL